MKSSNPKARLKSLLKLPTTTPQKAAKRRLKMPPKEFVPSCRNCKSKMTGVKRACPYVKTQRQRNRKKGVKADNKEYKDNDRTDYAVYGSSEDDDSKKSSQDNILEQYNDQNALYLQYVKHYLNCGLSSADAEAWAKYYIDIQYNEQQQPSTDEAKQNLENDGIDETLPKTNYKREKYRGKHHKNYTGNGDGYYNEIGYYFNPDGTFYDTDGFFYNPKHNIKDDSNLQEEVDPLQTYKSNSYFEDPQDFYKENYEVKYQDESQYHYENSEYNENNPKNTHSDSDLPAYIEYVTTYKYYDDLEYLYNTREDSVTFVLENLPPKLSKASLVKYFYDQGVDTRRIEVQRRTGTTAIVQAFSIPIAIQVLQQCGNYLKGRVLLIEIDQEDERMRLERLIEAL